MIKYAIMILAIFSLTGASCTTLSQNFVAGKVIINDIDSSLLKKCKLPIKIPNKKLTQEEIEKYWGLDRKELLLCAKKHGLLGDAIKFRDEVIKGDSPKSKK